MQALPFGHQFVKISLIMSAIGNGLRVLYTTVTIDSGYIKISTAFKILFRRLHFANPLSYKSCCTVLNWSDNMLWYDSTENSKLYSYFLGFQEEVYREGSSCGFLSHRQQCQARECST
jgi:hypothetical protein